MSIDISLLPRADLPVIWDDFKAKAEAIRTTAETLTVTCITQKEEMALARKTRLTLKEIRIAVEHKRVELGEGHLKEIQKVNGAARAIREFIEPLEARLLHQEGFAERAEEKRIVELAEARFLEASAIRPQSPYYVKANLGRMPQADFDALIERIKQEQAELESANRLRIEAEKRLAAQKLEMEMREAVLRAEAEAKLAAEREEQKRLNEEAERVRFEQEEKHRAEISANAAIRSQERVEAEQRRQEDLRIEREKTAKLEAELAQERAVKQAEADAARRLALAPDVEKLRDYYERLRGVKCPVPLATQEARDCFEKVIIRFNDIASIIRDFCPE